MSRDRLSETSESPKITGYALGCALFDDPLIENQQAIPERFNRRAETGLRCVTFQLVVVHWA